MCSSTMRYRLVRWRPDARDFVPIAREGNADVSDIDLVVSNKVVTEANKARLLAELARAMRQAYITDTVAIISKARVPIIKFVTSEGMY